MFHVFVLLWLTSYYVIHAYCVLCAVLWVGGVGGLFEVASATATRCGLSRGLLGLK